MNILEKIVAHKRTKIDQLPRINTKNLQPSHKNFAQVLRKKNKNWPNVIAEIKLKSPSMGDLFPNINVKKIAQIYEENGACAISVLTDEHFFGGSFDFLQQVTSTVNIPVLCKEFIIDEKQLYFARQNGADAVLLMTQILTEKDIQHFLKICQDLSMTGVVEIFDEKNLETALNANAEVILVNSRDFLSSDLKIHLDNFPNMLSKIPDNIVKIAASGLSNIEEVKNIAHLCDAILVGTNFMKLQNYEKIAEKIYSFSHFLDSAADTE